MNGEQLEEPAQSQFRLLINAGSHDDVKINERVLVFALGSEIPDPDTGENLGHFEIVRGEGKVISLQSRMAVVESTQTRQEQRQKPMNALSMAAGALPEHYYITVSAPFHQPRIGDQVRFI